MGRRAGSSDILASESDLAEKGIHVHKMGRGGLITYHGPGQLVVYPVFNLRTMGLPVPELVYGWIRKSRPGRLYEKIGQVTAPDLHPQVGRMADQPVWFHAMGHVLIIKESLYLFSKYIGLSKFFD